MSYTSDNEPRPEMEPEVGRRSNRAPKRKSYNPESFVDAESLAKIESGSRETEISPILSSKMSVLKRYFLRRLEDTVRLLLVPTIEAADLLKGWKVTIVRKTGGLPHGMLDVYYHNGKAKRYRSRVEVATSLGLLPSVRLLRAMTKEQHYLNAVENREKMLIAQLISVYPGRVDDIMYVDDEVKVIASSGKKARPSAAISAEALPSTDTSEPTEGQSTSSSQVPIVVEDHCTEASASATAVAADAVGPRIAKKIEPPAFSIGNITVLSWGKIRPNPAFHSASQLFPVGFKCIRQEQDVFTGRVVDCLCEIEAVTDEKESGGRVSPLYRLTVAWKVGNPGQSETVIRVYESRSPQAAWQAGMLETVGIQMSKAKAAAGAELAIAVENEQAIKSLDEETASVEGCDEDEMSLRLAVRDMRRDYFRTLRHEQSQGRCDAMNPRLQMEHNMDNFADEMILRMFEGMSGALECPSYQFVESRESDVAGRKSITRALQRIQVKTKLLERDARVEAVLAPVAVPKGKGARRQSTGDPADGKENRSMADAAEGAGGEVKVKKKRRRRRRTQNAESEKSGAAGPLSPLESATDMEARDRAQVEESLRKTQLRAKLRDMERPVRAMKENMLKVAKSRRDDARVFVEATCDLEESERSSQAIETYVKEEMEAISADDNAYLQAVFGDMRPPPIGQPIRLDPRVFMQTLSTWSFLVTFPELLGVQALPSIGRVMAALRACEPSFRLFSLQTLGAVNSFPISVISPHSEESSQELPRWEAAEVLDSLGLAFSYPLVEEYERLLGMDLIEVPAGSVVSAPFNALTWREIARVTLLACSCKSIGMTDTDVLSTIRGKPYAVVPDAADRKTMRLIRRRILFSYANRHENHEAIFGFKSGVTIRAPAPGPRARLRVNWIQLLSSLKQLPDRVAWLTYDITKASLALFLQSYRGVSSKSPLINRIGSYLQTALNPFLFDVNYSKCRELALSALKIAESELLLGMAEDEAHTTSVVSINVYAALVSGAGLDPRFTLPFIPTEASDPKNTWQIPISVFDLWNRQLQLFSGRKATSFLQLGQEADTSADFAEPGQELDQSAELLEEGEDPEDDDDPEDNPAAANAAPPPRVWANEDFEADALAAEKLSLAMQRCYIVIRDLMAHTLAAPFCYPVDRASVPQYYKLIFHPLSLVEIKQSLLQGAYADSTCSFYSDVNIVFENALAYNPETSTLNISAQKLAIIFDRMFLETVLAWDNPLGFADACHGCRSMEPLTDHKSARCERCDASYHLYCIDPLLTAAPKGDWHCPACVEQKSIASVHPNKTTAVVHSSDTQLKGQVVAIEQIRQTICFVVQFEGGSRELWSGTQVRAFCAASKKEEAVLVASQPVSDGIADATVDDEENDDVPELPPGYDYNDYDAACGLARGYMGWGASHSVVPSLLSAAHSMPAQNRQNIDPAFRSYRAALASLGQHADTDELTGEEWSTVFSVISHRVLSLPKFAEAIASFEESSEHYADQCFEKLATPGASASGLVRTSRIKTGDFVVLNSAPGDASNEENEDESDDEDCGLNDLFDEADEAVVVSNEQSPDVEGNDSDDDSILNMSYDNAEPEAVRPEQDDDSISGEVHRGRDSVCSNRDSNSTPFEGIQEGVVKTEGSGDDTGVVDESLESWEMRRTSRKRGRDDALLTRNVLCEIINIAKGKDEMDFDDEEYMQGFCNTVLKSCLNRSSENLDIKEWVNSWERKLASLDSLGDHSEEQSANTKERVCDFCGLSESYLMSQFVCGQTWDEWESDGDATSIKVGSKRRKLKEEAREKTRMWMPVDPAAVELEQQELASCKFDRSARRGSLCVHECCAEAISGLRRFARGRIEQLEDRELVDVLIGIGRAKTTPIGCDRNGHLYWYLMGSSAIYVYGPSKAGSSLQIEDTSCLEKTSDIFDVMDRCASDVSFAEEFKEATSRFFSSTGRNAQECSNSSSRESWSVYRHAGDIGRLILWLNPMFGEERRLRRLLMLLFPSAADEATKDNAKYFTMYSDVTNAVSLEASSITGKESTSTIVTADTHDTSIAARVGEVESSVMDISSECLTAPGYGADNNDHQDGAEDEDDDEAFDDDYDDDIPRFSVRLAAPKRQAAANDVVVGQKVLVETDSRGVFWDGRILEVKPADDANGAEISEVYYKVHFDRWSQEYDGWYAASKVDFVSTAAGTSSARPKQLRMRSREVFFEEEVAAVPAILRSLAAYSFRHAPHRSRYLRVPFAFSNTKGSQLNMLKSALLMVEAALPSGCMDESEDKWGPADDNIGVAWREAVSNASDASALMSCELMLEFSVRSQWLKPLGVKLMLCQPTRAFAARQATLAMVAMRLWTLDKSVRYDKIVLPEERKIVAKTGKVTNKKNQKR